MFYQLMPSTEFYVIGNISTDVFRKKFTSYCYKLSEQPATSIPGKLIWQGIAGMSGRVSSEYQEAQEFKDSGKLRFNFLNFETGVGNKALIWLFGFLD